MKLIDRLVIKAQKNAKMKEERLIMAFVSFNEDSGLFTSDCKLWNGKKGSGVRAIISTHITEDEAYAAAYKVADQYPNDKDTSIFFGDMIND